MKKVTVVGVGALGSHFVQFLRSEDVKFNVVDFDKVEQKNTLSQFHSKPSSGQLKVLALKQAVDFLWKMKIDTNSNKLTTGNAHQLLSGADLIVDCLDNAEARRIIQDYVRGCNAIDLKIDTATGKGTGKTVVTPCLHGAVDAEGSFGRVVWDEDFVIDSGSAPGTPTCEDGENLPFIASVASYIARSAQAFLRKGVKHGFQISPGGVVLTRT